MRKSLWIVLGLLLVAISAPNALADSYTYATLYFVGGQSGNTVGSLVYDNTTNEFTSFDANVPGGGFSLEHNVWTDGGYNATWIYYYPFPAGGGSTQEQSFFLMLTGGGGGTFDWSINFLPGQSIDTIYDFAGLGVIFGAGCCGTADSGTFTVVTPEPGTSTLLLLGIGFLISVARRRIFQNIQGVV